MSMTITDTAMTSDQTDCTARHAPDRNGWQVSWLPGQVLDRNTAITSMVLAETAAEPGLHDGHRLWPHIQDWAGQLGLTAPDAIARAAQPLTDPTASRNQPAVSPTARQPADQQARHQDQQSSHD